MTVIVPEPVRTVLTQLEKQGFEAFCVGGCVRDSLLGRQPNDWDVATTAFPEQIRAAFAGWRVAETGIRHGTLTVFSEGCPVEVTACRMDGVYSDGRHPDSVCFTRSLADDLARRDFTVNAIAFHPRTGLIDRFGGLCDLQNRVIRAVGDPARRFQEDALRILRALRFASVLAFSIEPATAQALRAQLPLLAQVSAERLFSELCKLACGAGADAVVQEYPEVIALLLGSFSPDGVRLHPLPADPALRLAMLMHRFSPEQADQSLSRLKSDGGTRRRVRALLSCRDLGLPGERTALRRLLAALGEQPLWELLGFQEALGRDVQTARARISRILSEGDCWNLGMLAVNGHDLLTLGIPPGAYLGRILQVLLEQVIEGALPNRRESLLEYADFLRRTT